MKPTCLIRPTTLRHDEGHVWAANSIRCGNTSNERAIVGGIQELATTTAGPHQGHELGLGSPNDPCVCGPALVVTINSFRNELNMIHKQLISACALMLLVLAGCDSGVVNVRALPTPEQSNRQPICQCNCISAIGRVRLVKGAAFTPRS